MVKNKQERTLTLRIDQISACRESPSFRATLIHNRQSAGIVFFECENRHRMSNDRHPVSFLRHRERSLAHVVGSRMRMM